MVRRARRRFDRLDIAVNNAGLFRYQTLTHKWREDQWDRMMSVNLKAVLLPANEIFGYCSFQYPETGASYPCHS